MTAAALNPSGDTKDFSGLLPLTVELSAIDKLAIGTNTIENLVLNHTRNNAYRSAGYYQQK